MNNLKKYFPLLVSLTILAVVAMFVPWKEVLAELRRLKLSTLLALTALSMVFYAGKVFRYWQMLRMLGKPVAVKTVALAYFTAQPVALLPAGELYRSVTLNKYADVPVNRTSSAVIAQGLIEAVGLLIISLLGALTMRKGLVPVLVLCAVFLVIIFGLKYSSPTKGHRLLNKLPGVSFSRKKYQEFTSSHKELFHRGNFMKLLLSSYITTFAGIAILMVATNAVGEHISFFHAAVAYALPVILGAVTFLPGGLGANEQGQVGILALLGIGFTPAVIITLLLRSFTLGIGLVYGLVAIIIARLTHTHARS
jgi:uncharacterized protein (TIRG00374 family)